MISKKKQKKKKKKERKKSLSILSFLRKEKIVHIIPSCKQLLLFSFSRQFSLICRRFIESFPCISSLLNHINARVEFEQDQSTWLQHKSLSITKCIWLVTSQQEFFSSPNWRLSVDANRTELNLKNWSLWPLFECIYPRQRIKLRISPKFSENI